MMAKMAALLAMGAGYTHMATKNKRKKKMKGDLNKDGKMSSYEQKRDKAIKKAMGKMKKKKKGY